MNGSDAITRWQSLKQRLPFKGLGCCGPTWSSRRATTTIRAIIEEDDHDHDHDQDEEPIMLQDQASDQQQRTVITTGAGMNLAMALAAERNLRRRSSSNNLMMKNVGSRRQVKTLMRLIEETEGVDLMRKKKRRDTEKEGIIVECEDGSDWVCCVCMEMSKGAAFIPCGHAFCRVCSREIWVNGSSCPICNRSIVQILDLF
ncbi:uncharacterized protein LOC126656105 [Mercurialis annua]|uniref:uncharacterized protein LOC126656105 n=1 Tax=Mercurialis annua TaxID=3986 RepID=UPI00215FA582|nr:uncharacterized protein LOC126656105 [Mercurialis annua]